MKKVLLFMFLCATAALPASAGSVNALFGWVQPSGDSDIYSQNEQETTFRVNDLDGFGGSVGYDFFLGDYVNVGAGFSYYANDTTVEDVDFEFQNGQPILRDIRLEIYPIEANIKFLLTGRDTVVIPYVGGGFGIYFWNYEEIGDFIFDRNTNPHIVSGHSFSDGADPGWHVEAGVFIPVGHSIAIMGEGKYWGAEGDLDIEGFDPAFEPIDLSGLQIAGGISFWF
jgi:Outer membrane protein beta-barrel domain